MPTVCEFIDWVKTPFDEEEPDLSELIVDDDFERTINFASNATCPAPLDMATSQGTFQFSFVPACTFAGMIKPIIIIIALLSAIYINLGLVRGGE
ncbi:Neisseria meningitidis TspB protein [compost metagenome]